MSDKRENSVLFSLKELRKIEKDRVQQQEEDDRRKADEDRRRADEEERRRRTEEERRIREEEERIRAEEAARKAQAHQSDLQTQVAAERDRMAQQFQQQMMMEQQRLRQQMAAEMSAAAPAMAAPPQQKQGKGMMVGLIIGMLVLGLFAAFAFINGNSKAAEEQKKRENSEADAKKTSEKMLAQLKELNDGQMNIQSKLDQAQAENKELKDKLAKAEEEAAALKAQANNDATETPEDAMKPGGRRPPMTGPGTSSMDPPPPMTMRCNPNDPTCFE